MNTPISMATAMQKADRLNCRLHGQAAQDRISASRSRIDHDGADARISPRLRVACFLRLFP